MKSRRHILDKVSDFIIDKLTEFIPKQLYFHNLSHTKDVVKAVKEIGKMQKLKEEELEMIEIAAWFHDVGYCYTYQGHEEQSKAVAKDFLNKENYPLEKIETIVRLIATTQYPQNPRNLNEMVMCDADLYHLSCEDYIDHEQRLRKEWDEYLGKTYTDKDWLKLNCEMLLSHQYFTEYGKTILQLKKEKNINKLSCKYY